MSIIRSVIKAIKRFIPTEIWNNLKTFKKQLYYKKVRLRYKSIARKLRKKEKIKVAFFLIHDSVWKYEGVYQLMKNDSRFEPIVIVCPYILYGEETMIYDMNKAYISFKNNGYNVVKTLDEKTGEWLDVKNEINPDIVFFTNPHNLTKPDYYIKNFLDRLTCYVPYSFRIDYLTEIQFNQSFHNLTWRNFYETDIHLNISKKTSDCKGKNVIVTGYPTLEHNIIKSDFHYKSWKLQETKKTKIIWAPHWTIEGHQPTILNWSCFILFADLFISLAYEYKDKIQLAFKPHPFLKQTLSRDDLWGIDKTNDYYNLWNKIDNCQLNDGEYMDLFIESDALIHDSGSFMVEYLPINKPVLYTSNRENITETFNEFGKLAFKTQYKANGEEDIRNFIENIVLIKNDYMASDRQLFINKYLLADKIDPAQKILNILNKTIN